MRKFVESLKRLYERHSEAVTIEKLREFVTEKKITEEEYRYIVGEG